MFECEVFMENINLENAKIFKAFCDETRLMVLSMLRSGEKCACELLGQVSVKQSTLSHHMKILVESGVVSARKEGKWMHYSISQEGSKKAIKLLEEITSTTKYDTEINKECCTWIKNLAASQAATVAPKAQV
jgi:ArsR family transcriptional regulator